MFACNQQFRVPDFLVFLLFSFYGLTSLAQLSDLDRAKLYFEDANDKFAMEKYREAYPQIIRTEECLTSVNARVLSLKVETLFMLKEYQKANQSLVQYESLFLDRAPEKLTQKTMAYYTKIERALEEEHAHNLAIEKAIKQFAYEDCERCNGIGTISVTWEKYGKIPWLKKDKCRKCDVCEGTRIQIAYPDTTKIPNGQTPREFYKKYEERILKHLNEPAQSD